MGEFLKCSIISAIRGSKIIAVLKTIEEITEEEIKNFAIKNPADVYRVETEYRFAKNSGLVIDINKLALS